MLKQRMRTGIGLALVFVGIYALSYISWVLPLTAAVLSVMSLYELQMATGFLKRDLFILPVGAAAAALAVLPIPNLPLLTGCCFVLALLLFRWLMGRVGKDDRIPDGVVWVIAAMLPIFFRCVAAIRGLEHGLYLVGVAVLVAVVTDVAAYLVGSRFGRRKLAPTLSPHKTVAGSVGGMLATVVLLSALSALVQEGVHWGVLALYLVLGSFVGQFGDLAMSAIKRIVGIKDYSQLLPGHGGVLDRFDSVLLILPFSYLFLMFFSVL